LPDACIGHQQLTMQSTHQTVCCSMSQIEHPRTYGDYGPLRALSRPTVIDRANDKAVVLACQEAIQRSKALLFRMPDAAARTPSETGADHSGDNILRIFYSSRIPESKNLHHRQSDIENIVRVSRKENSLLGITGVLVANTEMYSQIIEGPSGAIKGLIGNISCDARHQDVRIISRDMSKDRIFPNWSMEFILTDREFELQKCGSTTVDNKESSAIFSFCQSIGIKAL